jgi:hypothetical protein
MPFHLLDVLHNNILKLSSILLERFLQILALILRSHSPDYAEPSFQKGLYDPNRDKAACACYQDLTARYGWHLFVEPFTGGSRKKGFILSEEVVSSSARVMSALKTASPGRLRFVWSVNNRR